VPAQEISTEEAAAVLGVSPPTVRAWIEGGVLTGRQVPWGSRFRWRVTQESVELAATTRAPARVTHGTGALEQRVSDLEQRVGSGVPTNAGSERDDLRAKMVVLEDSLARAHEVAELQAEADAQRSHVIRLLTEALQAADRADELRRLALAQLEESVAGAVQPGHAGELPTA
jgi:excisionase family DNA binding protein